MISVVVDTTATFVDVMMNGTRWMQLLTLCANGEVDLVIPEVVLRETARHWEEESNEAVRIAKQRIEGVSKSSERLAHLGLDASGLPEIVPLEIDVDAETFLSETGQKLDELGVNARRIPGDVDIETVLERDLARKKPFNKSGKGFRDVLIWETLKEVVRESGTGDNVIFVTENDTDFCEDEDLHPELLAEVADAEGSLSRIKNLEALMATSAVAPLARGLAKTDEDLAAFLAVAGQSDDPHYQPPSVGEIVRSAMLSAAEDLINEEVRTFNETTSGYDFTEFMIPSDIESLSISWIEPDESSITWQTYETYQDATLLIRGEMEAEVSLEGFMYKSDIGHLEDHVEMVDWDWNDKMAQVVVQVRPRLIFQIRWEEGMEFVDGCELEGVEPTVLPDDDVHPWH